MKAYSKQGFTMIELLVVIVIIGILATSLFGPVQNFLLQGNLTGMMGNGRKVVQAIIAADMSGRYEGIAWPADENKDLKDSEDTANGPDMYKSFNSTPEYFQEALYVKESDVTKRNRLKVLRDIEPSMIAASGVPTATGATLADKNCAWILAKNSANAPSSAPVFCTRNVSGQTLVSVAGTDSTTDVETLLSTAKPFGRDGCVLVYKDGSSKKFSGAEIFPKAMIGSLGKGKLNEYKQGEKAFEFMPTASAGSGS
ncbi:MAG: type II secretion system protein [Kiritimatiellia bacterium]